jgi:quercetin dioxygenase-like cupin family protein
MKTDYFRVVACRLIVTVALAATVAGAASDTSGFIRIAPADMHWSDIPGGHGAQQTTLMGDPDKAGMYVIRVRFPPHLMDRPHWHPNARYVTVLEGTWYTGTGTDFDMTRAVPLKPGSVMLYPAKAAHWDGSGGAEAVVVQIVGEAPGESTPVDPAQSFWIEVPH